METGTSGAVVLLSGGLDSTVLLHHVAKDLRARPLRALSFGYGQKHSRELEMAAWQVRAVPEVIEHHVLDLGFFSALLDGASTLVTGGKEVPTLASLDEASRRQPPTYVPNRNMILLALAAAFAEARGCQRLFYGAQAQDEYGYWDCSSEFVLRINQVFGLNRKLPVQVEAPFCHLSKAEELAIGIRLGVDFSHTWSCYRGGTHPCGDCPTCSERTAAFATIGMVDPLLG